MNKKYKIKALVLCEKCGNSYTLSTFSYQGGDSLEYMVPMCCGFDMHIKIALFEVK